MKFLSASQHQQIRGGSSAPSVSAHSNAGTGASATLASGSTDSAGRVQLTTGTTPAGNGTIVTITFAKPYSSAPFAVIAAANENAQALFNVNSAWVGVATTTTTLELAVDSAPEASTLYHWNYIIVG